MIRSAKMNAITPPKLIPPFHSTAASGTLPIEQTNETIATSGRPAAPDLRQSGWWTRKNPARTTRAPTRRARRDEQADDDVAQIAAQSMTKKWLIAVNPRGEINRRDDRAAA